MYADARLPKYCCCFLSNLWLKLCLLRNLWKTTFHEFNRLKDGYFISLGKGAQQGWSPFTQLSSVTNPSWLPESPSGWVRPQVIPRYIPPITEVTFLARPSPHQVEVCTHHMMQAHTGRPCLNATPHNWLPPSHIHCILSIQLSWHTPPSPKA